MARIIISGYMIRHPVAGNLFAFFHYLLGLHRLGHQVVYLEESGWYNSCYDPSLQDFSNDPSKGLSTVRGLLAQHGVDAPVIYINRDSGEITGADWKEVKRLLGAADLLLNIGGVCWLPEFQLCRRRALVDMDPLFTQLGKFATEGLDQHHVHFSYGVNIGRRGCSIPTRGIDWVPVVPPVVTEIWQGASEEVSAKTRAGGAFTTVANWSSYDTVNYGGRRYGQKNEEFLRLLNLPKRTPQRLELALSGIDDETKGRLQGAGWSIRSGREVGVEVPSYRAYITGSRGEFSVAKNGYVKSRSGWFSDRSVCYLAAGLPVILQDTGFSDWLPVGRGVLAFSSVAEAVSCLEGVDADYSGHRRAARSIAERTFSYKVVLPQILEAACRAAA